MITDMAAKNKSAAQIAHGNCVELQYILDREEKSNKKVEGQSQIGYS